MRATKGKGYFSQTALNETGQLWFQEQMDVFKVLTHFTNKFIHLEIKMSDEDSLFDTYIATSDKYSCHMTFVIKCHKTVMYDILRQKPYDIDQH